MRHFHRFVVLGLLFLWSGVSQGAFKFVSWADNRPYDSTNRARFQWVLREMNRISGTEPAFHIVPGDFDTTDLTSADISNLSNVKTWYFAPGNHDTTELGVPNWSTNVGNAHFVFLNEYDCGTAGRACDHLYNWLVNDLNANTRPAVFVVGHEPAFPQNRHVGDSLDAYPAERDRFWTLLNQRKVIAYLCGHTHYYSTYKNSAGPTVQIDLGNAGNPSVTGNPQTFASFNVTDQNVDVYVYDGLQNESFSGGFSFSIPIPVIVSKATNPSPANGAVNVPTNAVLSWTAGSGAASHDVYLWKTGSSPSLVSGQQTGTSYTPTLEPQTPYSWRIDERDSSQQVVTGDTWTFTTKATSTNCYVVSETPVSGSVAGSGQTNNSDGLYESITEVLNSPGKNGYSMLEHIWRFNVVPGRHVEFRIEAFHSPGADGDDFALSYSTDGVSYTSMLTVTKMQDDNAQQAYTLPAGTSGTVYVKVRDTNRTKGSRDLDTVYVDSMYILSSDTPGTATTMNASIATSTKKATGPEVYGVATVTVTDNLGHAVSGATVEGTFTGDFWFIPPGAKTTDAGGRAVFDTEPSYLKRPVFGFDVSRVEYPGLVWQP